MYAYHTDEIKALALQAGPESSAAYRNKFDELYCARARQTGVGTCDACGKTTLATEVSTFGYGWDAPTLCDDLCRKEMDETVRALPSWVRDQDLPKLLPVLARAYASAKKDEVKT